MALDRAGPFKFAGAETHTNFYISCLFTHKCGAGVCDRPRPCSCISRCIGCRLKNNLQKFAVDLLVDPLRVGDHVQTRMETFDFDALLFLMSEESLRSEPCATELDTARRFGRPIFAVAISSELPPSYRDRLCMSLAELRTAAGVEKLGSAIREHVLILRLLNDARGAPPDVSRNAARQLYTRDSSTLAEFISELETAYLQNQDDATRYWIALAIGHTRASGAGYSLAQLRARETAPYPREGLNRALDALNNNSNGEHDADSSP